MKLEIRNLCKSFGTKQVLRNMSLSAESGSALGLLGRNGAGKTTTIRILLNIFQADSGSITADGAPLDHQRIRIGYLPEERGMYPKKKILHQLVYFAMLKGLSRQEAEKRCMQWLKRLDLSESAGKRLDTLSKGNQQKVQLITALIDEPDILVLDEPFSGLDPVNARIMEEIVREQIADGRIVFFSGHQMNYIEEFCDRIAILNEGHIVLQGKLDEIRRSYPRNRLIIQTPDYEAVMHRYQGKPDGHGGIMISLEDPSDRQRVMRELTSCFDIEAVSVYEPSLADIFVDYTGEASA